MRNKCLNFGISSAAEVSQNAFHETLEDIKGAININDDFLVFGNGQQEHNRALETVLKRLRERGLTLNQAKADFNKPSLEFLVYVFSRERHVTKPQNSEGNPQP